MWVNGIEQPRGLNALAINLSYDMYARDRGWLRHKLDVLNECIADDEAFDLPMPPTGELRRVPSLVAAMATLIRYRCEQLGAFAQIDATPVLDALITRVEPRTGADGTLSWTVDVANPATGDEFILGLKELQMPHGGTLQRRPYCDVAVGRLSESARWSVQGVVARHARDRSRVDREEASRTADVRGTEGRLLRAGSRTRGATAGLSEHDRVRRNARAASLCDARHSRRATAFRLSPMGLVDDPIVRAATAPRRDDVARAADDAAKSVVRTR